MHSVIVVGSGPAGHTACIYLARANLEPVLLEGDASSLVASGGLLTTTKTVENYPGFPEGIDGYDLTERFREQSLRFGTNIRSEMAIGIHQTPAGNFVVKTKEDEYLTKSVIIATGSTPRKLDVPGWNTFWNHGISTCAVCDGGLPCYRNVPVAVVGGGDSACEEALHLAHTASLVYMIHRRDSLSASKIMRDRVMKNPKIQILWNSTVSEICGDKNVNKLILKDTNTSSTSELPVRGLFVAIGHTPNSEFVKGLLELDSAGYIKTNESLMTSVTGIWAAGDVQDHKYRQAITAAASGCQAALEVERWLSSKDDILH